MKRQDKKASYERLGIIRAKPLPSTNMYENANGGGMNFTALRRR